MNTFGLLRKTNVFIKLPIHFEVSLKRSELFFKKLEEVPWIKREYDPFVFGKGRRRGARFNREGGWQRSPSLKYNNSCDPYFQKCHII